MATSIGTVFRWRRDALGVAAGMVGVCYTQLGDSYVGVLFDNGVPAALTEVELHRYAVRLGRTSELVNYRFEDLNRLLDDFSRGRFARAFRGICDVDDTQKSVAS